ncbi:MAG: hypothetical protein HXY25_05925 [Alphaproteobacteria bacterium]|nr:hypothetical protein [Alphaproteobacteria bacterium]
MNRPIPPTPEAVEAAFAPDALMAHVLAYDGFGIHRSGTKGDAATADWMAHWLGANGFEVSFQSFDVPHFEPVDVAIEIGGTRVEGFPQWPVTPTRGVPVVAPLTRVTTDTRHRRLDGQIAVIEFPYGRPSAFLTATYCEPILAALAAGAAGLIGVTTGPTGELIALNAPPKADPFPAPVMMIAPKDAGPVLAAAASGAQGRLVLEGEGPRPAPARNVIGRLIRPGAPTVVVTTPQSGWFHCAAERGPGIAIWRALAVWAAARQDMSFIFASTSGHELENTGAHAFIAEAAPPPDAVRLWLHLGAGFGARDFHEPAPRTLYPLPSADPQRYLAGTPTLVPMLKSVFAGQPGLESVYTATPEGTAGELAEVVRAGYAPTFGAFGGHRFHHAREDRADKTSPEILGPLGRAFRAAMEAALAEG